MSLAASPEGVVVAAEVIAALRMIQLAPFRTA
jgi:hypothetical protein